MALTPVQALLAESYFGDDSHLMFNTAEDFSLAFNTAQEAVDQGHSWDEIYQTGGDKTSLRNLIMVEDPVSDMGSDYNIQFSTNEAKGIASGINYWLQNGYEESYIREQMKGQGVSDDNLDRGFAYIEAKEKAGDRDVDLILQASQLGIRIYGDMNNENIEDAIKAHADDSQGAPKIQIPLDVDGGSGNDGPEDTTSTTLTLADSITIGGQEITFEKLNPLIQYLTGRGHDISIEDIRDAGDLNSETLISLFPPMDVALAKLDGINLAGDIYPEELEGNQIYYNELTGIFGTSIPLERLSNEDSAVVISEVGESVFRTFNDMSDDQKRLGSDGHNIVLDFEGKPITRGRAALSTNARRGSTWYVSSLDYNGDGVIDARDLQDYGSNLAVTNGISDPTHADIADALNASAVDVQTYVDLGFSTIAGDSLTQEEMEILSKKTFPGFDDAMQAQNEGRISERQLTSFDFNNDGLVDFNDFQQLVGLAPPGTQDNIEFLDSILSPHGGGVNLGGQGEKSTASEDVFEPVFQGSNRTAWADFVRKSKSEGLSDDDIRTLLRDKGANGESIIQAFLASETLTPAPDTNEGKAPGKTGSELFAEKLEEARSATATGSGEGVFGAGRAISAAQGLPFLSSSVGPSALAGKLTSLEARDKYAPEQQLSEEQVDGRISEKQRKANVASRHSALKGEEAPQYQPYEFTMPKDAFAVAQGKLSGENRNSLDTMAQSLGLKGSEKLSDSALKFKIASRQATNPEGVFGDEPSVSPPPKRRSQTSTTNTPAEAPSG